MQFLRAQFEPTVDRGEDWQVLPNDVRQTYFIHFSKLRDPSLFSSLLYLHSDLQVQAKCNSVMRGSESHSEEKPVLPALATGRGLHRHLLRSAFVFSQLLVLIF